MYKQYLNDYEKRAEQIRQAARAVESGATSSVRMPLQKNIPVKEEKNVPVQTKKSFLPSIFERFKEDDILLVALLFLLNTCDEKDTTMIIILGYLLLLDL